jgi:hypothetical protein
VERALFPLQFVYGGYLAVSKLIQMFFLSVKFDVRIVYPVFLPLAFGK